MEVDRVLQVQAAVSAYSGFIFDIKQDSDLKEFFNAAKILFQALKTDAKIPQKLLDSNRHLDWLRIIKEQHGSIEISSIQRVNAINATGVYSLNLAKETMSMKFSPLEQDIKSKKVDEYQKNIGEAELHELHSKLMLISKSDDGKKASERFINIFCAALRLKEVGTRLCEAGCFLFTKITIKVNCDPDKAVKMEINFGGDTGILKGYGMVEEEMEQLVSFLENCLSRWNERINETRNKFPGLNYFRTKQLVQLSQEIADALNHSKNISASAEMVLKLLDPTLKSQDVLPYFKNPATETAEEGIEDCKESTEGEIITRLMSEGYSKEISAASIVANGKDTEYEDLIFWCVENEDDDELVEDLFLQFEKEHPNPVYVEQDSIKETKRATMFGITRSQVSMAVDKSTNLEDRIKVVWDNFLTSMETVETSDFLSFECLGRGLDMISSKVHAPNRSIPKYIHTGKPNLIVAKKDEVHLQLLNMYHHNQSTQVPRHEEVLFLGSNSSLEDVELMMMRSFCDMTGKLYCIVNCERLDFKESINVEKLLTIPKSNQNYSLVFISSDDRRSYIKTALDKYRIAVPEIKTASPYYKFIYGHLETPMSGKDTTCKRLLSSGRAGMGKTLQAKRTADRLSRVFTSSHLYESYIDYARLIQVWRGTDKASKHVYHLNISSPQTEDLADFLFKMVVLNTIQDGEGNVWICRRDDLYLFEVLKNSNLNDEYIKLFPCTTSMSPNEALETIRAQPNGVCEELIPGHRAGDFFQVWDRLIFHSEIIQRTVNNLQWFSQNEDLDNFEYVHGTIPVVSPKDCLTTLLKNCPVGDPSFCELNNFASFLNLQLKMAEQSTFTNLSKYGNEWRNLRFKNFVVKFLIFMAQDFSTRSVEISDEGSDLTPTITERRRWENSNHPYIFFNADCATLSFLGLEVNSNCELVDEGNNVLIRNIMTPQMRTLLLSQCQRDTIPIFNRNFDNLSDKLKLKSLCRILGQEEDLTPDPSYKITSDNIKKLLAIRTRFMCNIGVVVMGETGCGKTRMVKFLCDLMNPVGPDGSRAVQNLILMKVHGGVTAEMIYLKVEQALNIAEENKQNGVKLTVLFFDEANTTR